MIYLYYRRPYQNYGYYNLWNHPTNLYYDPVCYTHNPSLNYINYPPNHFSNLNQSYKSPPNQNDDLISIILETKNQPLFNRYPNINRDQWKNIKYHPYVKELQQKYRSWIQQMRQIDPYLTVSHTFDTLFSGIAVTLKRNKLEKLKQLPFTKKIHLDEQIKRNTIKNHSDKKLTISGNRFNNLKLINVFPVHQMTDASGKPLDGNGIRVAVIDSGINESNRTRFVDKYNFIDGSDNIQDYQNHGTLIANIILDVAPGISLLGYKTNMLSTYVAALERALLYNVNVVNLSSGYSNTTFAPDSPIAQAIKSLVEHNVVVVQSVGNEYETDTESKYSPFAITVGATTSDGKQVALYSNHSVTFETPDVVAPGTYDTPLSRNSGTSFATPYVSGSIALMIQKHPEWTAKDILSTLATTATMIKDKEDMSCQFFSQGSGRINVSKAINTTTVISPIHFKFELKWYLKDKQEQMLFIRNIGVQPREYRVEWTWIDTIAGLRGEINPAVIVIQPGETGRITLSLTAEMTTDHGGMVTIHSEEDTWHIPTVVVAKPIREFSTRGETTINSLAWNGMQAAIGKNDTIWIWEGDSEYVEIQPVHGELTSLAYSPDGKKLVVGSKEGSVSIWDVETMEQLQQFHADSEVSSVAYNPNPSTNQVAALSKNNMVLICDVDSGKVTSILLHGSFPSIAYSPSGHHIATGSREGFIQIWDVNTGASVLSHQSDESNGITSIAYNPNGHHIATGSREGFIRIWGVNTDGLVLLQEFDEGAWVTSVSYNTEDTQIASTSKNGISIRDIESGILLSKYNLGFCYTNSVSYLNGRIAALIRQLDARWSGFRIYQP